MFHAWMIFEAGRGRGVPINPGSVFGVGLFILWKGLTLGDP